MSFRRIIRRTETLRSVLLLALIVVALIAGVTFLAHQTGYPTRAEVARDQLDWFRTLIGV